MTRPILFRKALLMLAVSGLLLAMVGLIMRPQAQPKQQPEVPSLAWELAYVVTDEEWIVPLSQRPVQVTVHWTFSEPAEIITEKISRAPRERRQTIMLFSEGSVVWHDNCNGHGGLFEHDRANGNFRITRQAHTDLGCEQAILHSDSVAAARQTRTPASEQGGWV